MSNEDCRDKIVNVMCGDHCINACLLKLHVRDDKIIKIETDDGPEPQYRACLKGRAYRQLVYHPDRILYPLRRTGERGEGKFERISWDEALETVASELNRVKATYGAWARIFLVSGGDISAYMQDCGGPIGNLLSRAGGFTTIRGTVSDEATRMASLGHYGIDDLFTANSRDTLLQSRLVILWGFNPIRSRCYGGHMPSIFTKLKEKGTRIIIVDPKYTETAAFCSSQWIPIRPSTDAAMLIAMAYVIITDNLQDQAFLDKYTFGFNEYKDYILGKEDGIPKTPRWAEEITGVPADTIAGLAREYATTKPAALLDGWAPARTAYGEQFNRAAATLIAMTGNLGVDGGSAGCGPINIMNPGIKFPLWAGVATALKGNTNPVDLASPLRKDSLFYVQEKRNKRFTIPPPGHHYAGGPTTASLNRVQVADAILKGTSGGYPHDYKLLYIVTCNWANQYGNTNKIIQALKKLEFVVVHEQFMTPTAKFADIILPQNTLLERYDLTTAAFSPFYAFKGKSIESVGESKSMFEIAEALAAKLGITDFSDMTEEELIKDALKVQGCLNEDIPDYEAFKKEGIQRLKPNSLVVFKEQIEDPEHNPFPTPSGKVEIYSQLLADLGNPEIPPIPKYIDTWESPQSPLAKKYPLQLITPHPLTRTHGRFSNVPWTKEIEAQTVTMNRVDAQARGIKNGDSVKVFNDRGQMIIPALVTERIMPGVVEIPEGAWYAPDENGVDQGGCPNIFMDDKPSPGGALVCNSTLVQIEKTPKKEGN